MVYFPDNMFFQMMHMVFFFNPAITNNIKFVNFPEDIHVARQNNSLVIFFPQHYDKFMFTDIKFTLGFNQNLDSK